MTDPARLALAEVRHSPRGKPDHGTDAGYQHHRLLGQRACVPCSDAHATGMRARRWAPRAGLTLAQWHELGPDRQDDIIFDLRIRPPRPRHVVTGRFVGRQGATL